jgi:hypothetical protein
MAHVVDRLLAQLPGLQGSAEPRSVTGRSSSDLRMISPLRTRHFPSPIGLWGRALLAVALGIMMTVYPYFRDCGLPLFGYLCAVAALVFAGGWVATIAWQMRNEVVHITALVVILWGLMLTADVVLPRSGYAAVPASWQCDVPPSGPSWMRWFRPSD